MYRQVSASGKACKVCGNPLRSDNLRGFCRNHKDRERGSHDNGYKPIIRTAWCSECGSPLNSNNLDGICSKTMECRRAKQRHRRDMIRMIKLDSGCVDCGYREHPAALEFDHRPGEEKKFGIATNMWRSWAEVLSEISKCDVRCANCHAVRTSQRRDGLTE